MKRTLFLCGSRYTLLNCINLAQSEAFNNEECDILIFCDKNMELLPENLKTVDCFRNVYTANFVNNYSTIKKIKLFLNPKSESAFLECSDNKYNLFISQSLFYASLATREFGPAEVYLIEEGLSTYTSRVNNPNRRSLYFKVLNKFLLRKNEVKVSGYYVYCPEMMIDKTLTSKALPKLTDQAVKTLEKVFKYDNTTGRESSITYLGSPYYGIRALLEQPNMAGADFENRCDQIVTATINAFNKRVIYRKHPREDNHIEEKFDNLVLDSNENIWELIVNKELTENSIIFSFFSTAAFTPKILYDSEPYVIFLCNLLDEKLYNADYLINGLRGLYRDKSKVFAPKNQDELMNVIRRIVC
jgi:hypothetical protein